MHGTLQMRTSSPVIDASIRKCSRHRETSVSVNRKAVMLRGALVKLSRASAAPSLSKVGNGRSISSIGVLNQKLRCLNKSNVYGSNGILRFSSSESPKDSGKTAPETATNRDDVDKESASKKSGVSIFDRDDFDDYEEPQTAGQKVKAYTWLGVYMILGTGAMFCLYLAYKELFGKQQPQNIASRVFETLRIHDDIVGVTGEPLTLYGRDSGRKEGRRNQIDCRTYVEMDGSNRTRIRFNVKGPRGHFMVWVEVSDRMLDNEYVYIIAKDTHTGRVVTIVDNRDRLDAEMELPVSDSSDPLAALLGGLGLRKS